MKISKQHLTYIIPILVIIPLIWYLVREPSEKTDNAYVEADITTIASEINGVIKEINFTSNQYVKADEPLIIIDPQLYENQLSSAKAEYELALLDKEKILAKMEIERLSIMQGEASLQATQADLSRIKSSFKREENLLSNKFASMQKYEESKTNLAKLEAQAKVDEADLEKAKKTLQITELDLQKADHVISKAAAGLRIAEKSMKNTIIRATFNSYAANKAVSIGDFVRVGSPLLSLVPEEKYIIANFKETQISKIRAKQKVQIKLDALPSQTLYGEVETISPATGALFSLLPPENATGNFTKIVQRFPVRIKFTGEIPDLIKPGLSAVVKIYTNTIS